MAKFEVIFPGVVALGDGMHGVAGSHPVATNENRRHNEGAAAAYIGTYFTDETKGGNLYTGGNSQSFLRPSAVSHTTRYTSALSSAETETGTAIYGPAGEYAVLVPERTFTIPGPETTRTPQAGFEQPFNNIPGSDYYFATPIAPATLPVGVGDQRSTRTMHGYAAALVDARSSGGVFSTYSLLNTAPEGVTISTDAAGNRASGIFALFDPDNPGTYTTIERVEPRISFRYRF